MLEREPLARGQRLRLTPAVHVWASVLSVPEPRWAILGAGRRDFGDDAGPPRLVRHVRHGVDLDRGDALAAARIVRVNDQPATVALPDGADLRVGDLVALGPAHPCTTFDKRRTVHLVADDLTVLEVLETYF